MSQSNVDRHINVPPHNLPAQLTAFIGRDAESAQQLPRVGSTLSLREHHRTKAARIIQAQNSMGRHEIKVIVQRRLRHGAVEAQAAGHTQVHQQQAAVQVQQQVLAAPPDRRHRTADERARLAAERPTQGLADTHFKDAGAGDAAGKAAARDLDFGEFGHGCEGFGL